MKKYVRIAYIFLIILILLSIFLVYKVSGKNNSEEKVQEKSLASIQYLDNKFSDLFNEINNIKFENYTISVTEQKKEENSSESQQGDSSSGKSGEGSGGESENSEQGGDSEKKGGSQQGESSNSESGSESSESNKQYNLEEKGILTNEEDIDWTQIKKDVEKMYTSLYPSTLDLYKTNVNQDDISNFNKEFDKLTKAVKEENKEDTLKELSTLYDYLPKFVDGCTDDEAEKIVIRTKNNIFKAYSILDKEEWTTISDNVKDASQEFAKLVDSTENQKNKNQYNINKAYVMINELQNSIDLKEKEIFLIKYKNLLEELENV